MIYGIAWQRTRGMGCTCTVYEKSKMMWEFTKEGSLRNWCCVMYKSSQSPSDYPNAILRKQCNHHPHAGYANRTESARTE